MNFNLRNSILIINETQNIPDICWNSNSWDINFIFIEETIKELTIFKMDCLDNNFIDNNEVTNLNGNKRKMNNRKYKCWTDRYWIANIKILKNFIEVLKLLKF